MKKFLPFSKRQPSLDRFAVNRGGWTASDRSSSKSLRRISATSLNTKSIQVVPGAYNIDLNKVDSKFTKLHRACLLNDDAQVRKHIQKIDTNSHDSSKRYPLHLATVNGNFAIIKLLIENGANPNVQDNENNTPLLKSIECGHEHLVKYLLNNGADPNLADLDKNTALHCAIMTDSTIAIEALLVSKKCDLLARNAREETCLHLAVRNPMINALTFEALVSSGADLTARDQLGLTPVDIALPSNNEVAMSVFNRYLNSNNDNSGHVDQKDSKVILQKADDKQLVSSQKLYEEYKQKYMIKNRENLEYEKKLIQLSAQIERIMLDMSYLKEQSDKTELDLKRATHENNRLKLENARLSSQAQQTCDIDKTNTTLRLSTESLALDNEIGLNYLSDDSIDANACKGHKEFIAAKNLLQDQIDKLKSEFATMPGEKNATFISSQCMI